MHPRANPKRQDRDGRGRAPSGRTQEIQRLVGRALRAAVALDKLGARTVTIDCDVLEADGGTRTASITGGFIALALAIHKMTQSKLLASPVLRAPVAAVSAGIMENREQLLDLCYVEDASAEVDFNVVATGAGAVIELQGTAEGAPVPRAEIDALVDLCLRGVAQLAEQQSAVLAGAGVNLEQLLMRERGR
jgi:ribonuclease PH